MNTCAAIWTLRSEMEQADHWLLTLFHWKWSASVGGHENTLSAIEGRIEVALLERARIVAAFERHQKAHGCAAARGAAA